MHFSKFRLSVVFFAAGDDKPGELHGGNPSYSPAALLGTFMAGLLGLAVAELGGCCGEEERRMDEDMDEGGYEEFQVYFEDAYDAPRFFDFCRWKSDGEARVSERWFESALRRAQQSAFS